MSVSVHYRGAFSEVVLAENKSERGKYNAIKCINRRGLRGKEEALDNEISVLRRLVSESLCSCDWEFMFPEVFAGGFR